MFTSLKLTNFKGFQEATLPLGPLTLLVGTNASGKSNVREALQFLHGCSLGYSLAEILGEKWGHGVLLWRGPRGGAREIAFHGTNRFGLEIGFTIPQGKAIRRGDYSITVHVEENGKVAPRVTREEIRGHRQGLRADACGTGRPRVWARPQESPTPRTVRQYSSARPALDQLIDDPPDKTMEAVARDVCAALGSMRFMDFEPRVMREASPPGQALGDQGESLSSVLLRIAEDPQRKEAILGWLRALTPADVADLRFKQDLQGRILVYLVEKSGYEISAYSASDGTLRFLALIAALLSPDAGRFFFFEEIDNGIHPTRLHVLLDALERLGSHMGCQIVATTHNPQLLAFLSEKARQDAVLLYWREESESAEAVRIMDLPNVEQIIKEQDLGRLFASGWLEDMADFLADQDTVAPETARV